MKSFNVLPSSIDRILAMSFTDFGKFAILKLISSIMLVHYLIYINNVLSNTLIMKFLSVLYGIISSMSSLNGNGDMAFQNFWNNVDARSRGGWEERDLGKGRQAVFDENSIQVNRGFVQEEEMMLLCNLVNQCEYAFGSGLHGSSYDSREMATVIERSVEFDPLPEFLECVVNDMKGSADISQVELKVARRYMEALPPKKSFEQERINTADWIIFLNHDYLGGSLWFPTRKLAIAPQAGMLVRFASGIPNGLSMVHGGYAFTLAGKVHVPNAER